MVKEERTDKSDGDRTAQVGGRRMGFRWTAQLPPNIRLRDALQKASSHSICRAVFRWNG
jgi:hypothetical protein